MWLRNFPRLFMKQLPMSPEGKEGGKGGGGEGVLLSRSEGSDALFIMRWSNRNQESLESKTLLPSDIVENSLLVPRWLPICRANEHPTECFADLDHQKLRNIRYSRDSSHGIYIQLQGSPPTHSNARKQNSGIKPRKCCWLRPPWSISQPGRV